MCMLSNSGAPLSIHAGPRGSTGPRLDRAARVQHALEEGARRVRRGPVRRRRVIDINTASAADLDAVPVLHGHGFEIVRYREERGRFTALRQLDEVPGLAGKTDGVEAWVTVGDA